MKTIIVYATKSGAARECAELLATRIADCALFDLSKQTVDIDTADTVIIGSGVRMGRIYKPARKFLDTNHNALLSKRTAIYLCNGEPETFQKTVDKNIPAQISAKSICIKSFGGKQPFTSPKSQDWILTDNVNGFLQAIGQA
jgi:menaquinone-dependent protoporphyrinogen oxidase